MMITRPTQRDPLDIVISESLERELNLLRAGASGSLSGLFGRQSMTWRINREAAIFFGRRTCAAAAARTLGLPLQSSSTRTHLPIRSTFHRTFSTVFHDGVRHARPEPRGGPPATFSSCHDRRRVALGGRTIPGRLLLLRERGERAALGSRNAVGNGARGPRACAARAQASECEGYYAEGCLFAGLFGIRRELLPPDWAGFSAYIDAMTQSST